MFFLLLFTASLDRRVLFMVFGVFWRWGVVGGWGEKNF